MGTFAGIGETEVFERGVFLSPGGTYLLKLRTILLKETRKSGLGFIVEFEVVESTHPDHSPGSKATWFQKMTDKDVAFPAIKQFFVALFGIDLRDPEAKEKFNAELEQVLDEATAPVPVNEQHPLEDMMVKCSTYSKLTQKGMDFTVHNWETAPDEVAA